MSRAGWITVLLAAGATLVLAACGSSANQQSAARARYVAQAEQLCRGAQAQTSALVQRLSSAAVLYAQGRLTPASARALAPAARRLQATAAALHARLAALRSPSGDAGRVAQFLTPMASLVSSISAAAGALTLGDSATAASALAQVLTDGQRAQAAASAYGLKQCATAVLPAGF